MAEYKSRHTVEAVRVVTGDMPFDEMTGWLLRAIADGEVTYNSKVIQEEADAPLVYDVAVYIKQSGRKSPLEFNVGDFIVFDEDEITGWKQEKFIATYKPPTGWRTEERNIKQFDFLKK